MNEDAAAAGIVDLYRRHGRAWAALRGERLIEGAWLERFAALLPPDATVLDLGCGPGVPIARWLVTRGFPVTGIDAAPVMIELARAAMPEQRWLVADMRGLALPGAGLMFTSGPAAGIAIGDLFGEPLFHASLAGSDHTTLLEQHGFTVVAQKNEDPACGGHTVWLAQRDRPAQRASP